jgi:putative hydrolase of the HAD superfamily
VAPSNPIEAVTFDAGGTLIEPTPSVGHIYAATARLLGYRFDPEELEWRFREAWRAKGNFDYSVRGWQNLVAVMLDGFVTADALPELFAAIYERFKDPAVWRIYPDESCQIGTTGFARSWNAFR